MTRIVFAAALCATAAVWGCSSHRCEGDLAEVGRGCPQTFDGTEAQLPRCPPYDITYIARVCGDVISVEGRSLFSGGGCYYDATSHQLVGAAGGTDVPAYCNETSSAIYAGRVASCSSEPIATKDCSSQP